MKRALPLLALLVVPGVVMAAVAPGALAGQEGAALRVGVDLTDYGLESAAQVLRGRVSATHAADGPTLGVYWLRSTASRPRANPPGAETHAAPPSVPGDAVAGTTLPTPGGLWVWSTHQLLDSPDSVTALAGFVADHQVARVFLQLPPADGARASAGFVPFDGPRLGRVIRALTTAGARVWALDGDPAYALPANHNGVLRTIQRVVSYNRAAPPEERFEGVHYDVEPYLVPGFQGPRRGEILDGWVRLVSDMARVAHDGGLKVGVDIPFWLDAPDEETGEPLTAVLDGRSAPVLEHLLGAVDQLAIMDYRTRPDGPDGIVAHAWGEMEAAEAAGVNVLLGLETGPLADEDLYTFTGPGVEGLPPAEGRWVVLAPGEGRSAAVWLVDGPGGAAALRADLGVPPGAEPVGLSGVRHWPAGTPIRVAADKQSFGSLGPDALRAAAARTVAAFQGERAFAGIAYHSYTSLKALLAEVG